MEDADDDIEPVEVKEASESEAKAKDGSRGNRAWSDTKKAIFTQGLALLVTPITVVTTLVVTEHFKAPTPDIQYTTTTAGWLDGAPDDSFRKKLNEEPRAASAIRDQLQQRGKLECIAWLDGEPWDSDCATRYRDAVDQLIAFDLTSKTKSGGSSIAPILGPDASEARRIQDLLTKFQSALKSAMAQPRKRTGGVQIQVGILNKGSSDGTVDRTAKLIFQGKEFDVFAPEFVAVKAHGFEKMAFTTPDLNGDSISGEWNPKEDAIVKEWAAIVKSGKPTDFKLRITMPEKRTTEADATVDGDANP